MSALDLPVILVLFTDFTDEPGLLVLEAIHT